MIGIAGGDLAHSNAFLFAHFAVRHVGPLAHLLDSFALRVGKFIDPGCDCLKARIIAPWFESKVTIEGTRELRVAL